LITELTSVVDGNGDATNVVVLPLNVSHFASAFRKFHTPFRKRCPELVRLGCHTDQPLVSSGQLFQRVCPTSAPRPEQFGLFRPCKTHPPNSICYAGSLPSSVVIAPTGRPGVGVGVLGVGDGVVGGAGVGAGVVGGFGA